MKATKQRGNQLCLKYGEFEIVISSECQGDIGWLREFLCPPYGVSSISKTPQLSLKVDEGAYLELAQRGPHVDGGIGDLFTLDGDFESHQSWNDDALSFHDREQQIFYRFFRDHTQILASENCRVSKRRLGLLRLVREFSSMHCRREGNLQLHGAAVSWKGKAIAFLGPRRAGKSTTLLHCLRTEGANFVTNDRLIFDAKKQSVVGMPTIVSIRAGSLKRMPDLQTSLKAKGPFYVQDGENWEPRPEKRDRIYLGPHQLCTALALERVGRLPIGAFVFPEISGCPGGVQSERLSSSIAFLRLRDALLSAGRTRSKNSPSCWLGSTGESQIQALKETSTGVPCYQWNLGEQALLTAAECERALDSL